MKAWRAATWAVTVVSAAAWWACSEKSSTGPTGSAPATLAFSATAPAYVRRIVIQVSGPGMDTARFGFVVDTSGTVTGVITVSAGSDRQIVGRAYDSSGVNTHEGDTTLTLVPGVNPPLTLVLRPLAGQLPIVVTFGSYQITLAPGDTTVAPGDTVRYSAKVTNEKGQLVAASPIAWSTSDPTVAIVDSTGLVTALAAGGTTVTATFGGAAATRLVYVSTGVAPVAWVLDTVIPGGGLGSVWGSGPTSIFALGPAIGDIVHFDGSKWSIMSSGTGDGLNHVWGVSTTSVYASGGNFAGTTDVVHFDGSNWTKLAAVPACQYVAGVWGESDTDLYGVCTDGQIFHYDGTAWSAMVSPTSGRFGNVWGLSDSSIIAVGSSGLIARFNGTAWVLDSSGTTADLLGIWGASPSDVFVAGTGGVLLHFDGTSWSNVSTMTTHNLSGVWGTSDSNVVVVGDSGTILHFDGASWHAMSSGTLATLSYVWASSPTSFVVTAWDGTILRSH